MAGLSGDAFVKALQSDPIQFIVGPTAVPLTISKALLCHKSETFAKLLSKPGLLELRLPNVGADVGKIFVCWCYQGRLQGLGVNPSAADRREWKELLINLWLLGDDYGIPSLQNQAMKQLTGLFVTPYLLNKKDIEDVWSHKPSHEELQGLLICTLVAQLEAPNAAKTIYDYEDLAALPKFMAKLYKALQMWVTFDVPVKAKKNKWVMLLQSERLQKGFLVSEMMRKVSAQAARAPARPFAPGEIIEID
ncbi:hypothetical protein LTR85_007259 [Meristemomyces frigidus]|nr:hypothetical protein LTR85_007259 [Meristemomyces frigidus]